MRVPLIFGSLGVSLSACAAEGVDTGNGKEFNLEYVESGSKMIADEGGQETVASNGSYLPLTDSMVREQRRKLE
jgi:hypothetical protein